ncbi:CTU2 [Bugula neritina]|uniref:Cytoplasmic tRNA 2-thiolation protein 2 n=1 Tax=Bugula neritina TaxID=10212 RepID=A0A7J7K9W3_BUGNE|nr:CTU2 [Bugula neritina]
MCTSLEDGGLSYLKINNESYKATICMKCKVKSPQVVIRVNDAFCRECFLMYCTHKFRSAFGKSKIIRDGEKVLVAFSGGQASTAMLHLVKEGKSVRAQKKLRFVPGLIYVDEGAVLGHSNEDRQRIIDRISELFMDSGYEHHIIKLEQVFSEEFSDATLLSPNNAEVKTSQERLQQLFDSVQTITAKEQFLRTLRQQLISQVAKSQGYSKVIIGDTSSRLSVALLSSMAQGKGAHIAYDTSLIDDRYDQLLLIRPMREFTSKEVTMYNRFYGLNPLVVPTFTTKATSGASIDKLTETFVSGLQAEFPSTVSTIMRTGDKLSNGKVSMPDADGNTTSPCMLCLAPLDISVAESSALGSVRYTNQLAASRKSDSPTSSADNISASLERSCDLNSYDSSCCYSCQRLLEDMPQPKFLPGAVFSREQSRLAMKSYIEENLLS